MEFNFSDKFVRKAIAALLVAACVPLSLAAQQPPPPERGREDGWQNQDGISELNRGLVHEAFAQPYEMVSGGDYVIDQKPPEPIQEQPSRAVPRANDYEWIPGYWGWESIESRFVWISGIWRRPPEEMNWNPGYWVEIDRGYAWVSGFWSRDRQHYFTTETPPEPRQEDRGRQPSDQHFWVPGHWKLTESGYQWSTGYWAEGYPERVWNPFHYVWTPQGYLAISGYWDYELEDRGVVFCPVAIESKNYANVRYTPQVVLRTNRIPTHLFVDQRYGHYRFGDYYVVRNRQTSFRPWVSVDTYDPLRVFYQTFNQNQFSKFNSRHDYYLNHVDQRPRHTWSAERQFQQQAQNLGARDALLAAGVNLLLNEVNDGGQRIPFVEDNRRWDVYQEQNQQFRNLQQQRQQQLRELEKARRGDIQEFEKRRREMYREAEKDIRERANEAQQQRKELEDIIKGKIDEVTGGNRGRGNGRGNGNANQGRGNGNRNGNGNGRGNGNGNGNGRGNG